MAAAEDEDPVEAVGANRAYATLVERVAELGVAIMDEESERLLVRELHGEVARLLGEPASVRVRAAGDVLDPPGRERDEEEEIDPLQEDGSDGQEVAGERARCLRSQEGSPRRMRSLWRRLEARLEQHLRTEVAETEMPRPLSSPNDPLVSQCGFSVASRTISSRSERSSGGRPGDRCEYVHRRTMSWRCQRSSVSGLNGKAAQAARGVSGSTLPGAHDPLVSASVSTAAGGGSPAHGGDEDLQLL